MQQRQKTLRAPLDTRTRTRTRTTTSNTRAERIERMRTRALQAAIRHDRADLLQQLHSHMGDKLFAQSLTQLHSHDQVAALRMLSAVRRASVFQELSQTQRELWHKACQDAVDGRTAGQGNWLTRCLFAMRAFRPFRAA